MRRRERGAGARMAGGVLAIALWAGLGPTTLAAAEPGKSPPPATPWTFDRSTFDTSVDACSDFYRHVCGGWDTAAHLPADTGSAWWTKDLAERANEQALRNLLLGQEASPDPEVRRLRTFVRSCMSAGRDAQQADSATLRSWLARIDGVRAQEELMSVLAELHAHGVTAFFEYTGVPDPHDSRRYRAQIDRGSLGLRRSLYDAGGATADERRQAYRTHMTRMLELAGVSPAQSARDAAAAFQIEAALAAIPPPADPGAGEHPVTQSALAELAPHVDWAGYLRRVGKPPGEPLNVVSPPYLQKVDELLDGAPLPDVRAYLRWRFLDALGPALPGELAAEHYRFVSLGTQRERRFAECTLMTIRAMGVELSRQYSLGAGATVARRQARALIGAVQEELARAAGTTSWLSPAARRATAQKLRLLDVKVGFPDVWPATGSFPLHENTFLDNVLAARAYEAQRGWAWVRSRRSRESWEMLVWPNAGIGMAAARLTIPNAYPDADTNSIIFTAAELQPPIFDADAPPEVRYGGLGAVVAHEIVHVMETHEYDGHGLAHDLWSPADVQAHQRQSGCLVAQADEYTVVGGDHLNGRDTFDENVADLGGVPHTYAAMARELGSRLNVKGADGFTAAQRFFIAYAQSYCSADSADYLRANIRTDPHGPGRFRVNGPLSSMPEFARAFSCAPGSPMARPAKARCKVW